MRVRSDALVIGGGIAGLCILGSLRSAGYTAHLLERDKIGAGQTIASQGIIHGGLKFSLNEAHKIARPLSGMPKAWMKLLRDSCDSRAAITSDRQLMCFPKGLRSSLLRLAAAASISSSTDVVADDQVPDTLRDLGFDGHVLALHEPVLDVKAALTALHSRVWADTCHITSLISVHPTGRGPVKVRAATRVGEVDFVCDRCFVAGGAGIGGIASLAGATDVRVQRRPLRMFALKGDLPPLFAHYVNGGLTPTHTVTTHRVRDGATVWYVGGGIAEVASDVRPDEGYSRLKGELRAWLPNLSFGGLVWSHFDFARHEPLTIDGLIPGDVVSHEEAGVVYCWPSKLSLAPRLAQVALSSMERVAHREMEKAAPSWPMFPRPTIAEPPWESAEWKR